MSFGERKILILVLHKCTKIVRMDEGNRKKDILLCIKRKRKKEKKERKRKGKIKFENLI